ncbi:MAG: peptidylprolyl isomerase [Hyphomonadaceae bacterium]|nr:peptidylprolyl isomerase [Hyphomonadaceae bacterium]
MKRIIAIALAVTAASAGLALAQQTPQPAAARGQTIDGIVASVNDEVISQSDVRNRMRWMLLRFEEQPDEQIMGQIQQEAIENLIEEKVQLHEFRKLVKDEEISPAEVDENLNELARGYKLTKDQFLRALSEAGIPEESIRDMEKAKIAWTALIRGRYFKQVRVSELRIDGMLERIEDGLGKPQYRLFEIFLYAPDQASRTNARARAETLIKNINEGADFATLAQQFSASPSAAAGGDLSWLSPGDMRSPEIEKAVMEAPTVPTLLPPIESDGGVYVIAVTGKREPSDPKMAMILNLEQVIARGEGATDKLTKVKTDAADCASVAKATNGVDGLTHTPMKDVGLQQIAPAYRAPLENLSVGQSTDIIDTPDGGKMIFYVCEKKSGNSELPSRDEIKDRLFNQELGLVAERYLRDLKREATIVRR